MNCPSGTTFSVPFSAGVIKTAAGATVSVNAARPNPNQGAVNVNSSDGKSWYNAMILDVHRRLAAGVQVNGAFTWSKAENTAGSGNGEGAAAETAFNGGTPANQFNLASDRGLSPLDQRYRLVMSAVWEPRGRVLRGFRLSAHRNHRSRPASRPNSSACPRCRFWGPTGTPTTASAAYGDKALAATTTYCPRWGATAWPGLRTIPWRCAWRAKSG